MNRLSVRAVSTYLSGLGYDVQPLLDKAARLKADRERFEHLQRVRAHRQQLAEQAQEERHGQR
ncbi:hypothetical protein BH10PSE17_BH10PSE17_25090 [soil metagenome]